MKKRTIFISYCWSNQKHKEWVLRFANRLRSGKLDVILDRWNLKLGHDINYFIEESIEKSDKVLIVCNRDYKEKANYRSGGVGIETAIITPNVYNKTKQEKFIPIFREKDKNGTFYIPTFLTNRMGIDFTDENKFDKKVDDLLKSLLKNDPDYTEPEIDKEPVLKSTKSNFSSNNEYYSYLLGFTFSKMIFINNDSIIDGLIDQLRVFSKKINLDCNLINKIVTILESKNIITERTKIGLEKSEEISDMLKSRYGEISGSAFFFGFDLIFIIGLLSLIPKEANPQQSPEIYNNLKMIDDKLISRMLLNGQVMNLPNQDISTIQLFRKLYTNLNKKEEFQNKLLSLGLNIENMLKQKNT